jgi:hypothetical protein
VNSWLFFWGVAFGRAFRCNLSILGLPYVALQANPKIKRIFAAIPNADQNLQEQYIINYPLLIVH